MSTKSILLGIGGCAATSTPGESLKTLALGSCVGLVFLDPAVHAVGLVHIALPESKISPDKVASRPGYFADTAIPLLIECMRQVGSKSPVRSYIIKLCGGAMIMDPNNTFNIGNRNVLAVRKLLWQLGTGPVAEDVGGRISRSVVVDVDNGGVTLSSAGKPDWVL